MSDQEASHETNRGEPIKHIHITISLRQNKNNQSPIIILIFGTG